MSGATNRASMFLNQVRQTTRVAAREAWTQAMDAPVALPSAVPMNVSPITTSAPQLPPLVPTSAAPIVTLAPTLTRSPYSPITTSAPMSLVMPNASPISGLFPRSFDTVPIGAGGGTVNTGTGGGGFVQGANNILDLIQKGIGIFSGGGSSIGGMTGGGPSSGSPSIPQPGTIAINQAGMGSALGKVGAAIGKSRWIKTVIGGALSYVLYDTVTGAIKRISSSPPHRRMNVLNPRALSRANRRVVGFSHVARKTLHQLGYKVEKTRHVKAKAKAFGGRYKRKK